MKKPKNNISGQSVLEYTVFIIIVVAALLAMFGFLRRSLRGSWREAADSFGSGRQYEEGLTQVSR